MDDGYLIEIKEETVQRQPDGRFVGRPIRSGETEAWHDLSGDEVVSMNLWGFSEGIFDDLNRALRRFDPSSVPHTEKKPPKLLLPDVAGAVVRAGLAQMPSSETTGRCIGITHPDDLPLVRSSIADLERARSLLAPDVWSFCTQPADFDLVDVFAVDDVEVPEELTQPRWNVAPQAGVLAVSSPAEAAVCAQRDHSRVRLR